MDLNAAQAAAGDYNDTNRAFLQGFLARGTLTIEEGRKLLAAIFSAQDDSPTQLAEVTEDDFHSYVSGAADAISPFDYEIRSLQHQVTKTRIFALVNSNSDPLTQLATTRTPEEILYLRRLLDGMFETYNRKGKEIMAITGLQAGQGVFRKGAGRQTVGNDTQSVDKGLTQEQVEKLLTRLESENWLERSKAGFYTLSPRALMELRSWLVDTYNDNDSEDADEWQRIKFCEACRDIVTVGQRCSDVECNVRLHNICLTAYFNSRPTKKCPKCRAVWKGDRFVGEKSVTTTEDYLRGKRRSGGGGGGGGGGKRGREEENEEEQEQERDEPVERRRKGLRAAQAPASEEEEEEEEEERPAARRKGGGRAAQVASAESEDAEEDEDDE